MSKCCCSINAPQRTKRILHFQFTWNSSIVRRIIYRFFNTHFDRINIRFIWFSPFQKLDTQVDVALPKIYRNGWKEYKILNRTMTRRHHHRQPRNRSFWRQRRKIVQKTNPNRITMQYLRMIFSIRTLSIRRKPTGEIMKCQMMEQQMIIGIINHMNVPRERHVQRRKTKTHALCTYKRIH